MGDNNVGFKRIRVRQFGRIRVMVDNGSNMTVQVSSNNILRI